MAQWSVDFSLIDDPREWKKGSHWGMSIKDWGNFKDHIPKVTETYNFPYAQSKQYHFMKTRGGHSGWIRFEKDNYRAYGPANLGNKSIVIKETGDKKYVANALEIMVDKGKSKILSLDAKDFSSVDNYFKGIKSIVDEVLFYGDCLREVGVDIYVEL